MSLGLVLKTSLKGLRGEAALFVLDLKRYKISSIDRSENIWQGFMNRHLHASICFVIK